MADDPVYHSYDSDAENNAWLHLEDAVSLHRASVVLQRDKYSAQYQALPPDRQQQRATLIEIARKVIESAANDSLDQALEAWTKFRTSK